MMVVAHVACAWVFLAWTPMRRRKKLIEDAHAEAAKLGPALRTEDEAGPCALSGTKPV